jgi:hypothetical protein
VQQHTCFRQQWKLRSLPRQRCSLIRDVTRAIKRPEHRYNSRDGIPSNDTFWSITSPKLSHVVSQNPTPSFRIHAFFSSGSQISTHILTMKAQGFKPRSLTRLRPAVDVTYASAKFQNIRKMKSRLRSEREASPSIPSLRGIR